jgi:putative redox protein
LVWVTAAIGKTPYRVDCTVGRHLLIADEGVGQGGRDEGPAPYALLLTSLGACTAITLKVHAEANNWPLETLEVDLQFVERAGEVRIKRILSMAGALSSEQRNALLAAAERTPVTLVLRHGIRIHTELR